MLYTTNNIKELDVSVFKKVTFKDRFIARILDAIVFWMLYFILDALSPIWLYIFKHHPFEKLPAIIISLSWFLLRDGFRNMPSWGKKTQEIIVICSDTLDKCTMQRSFIRNIISDLAVASISLQFFNILYVPFVSMLVLLVDVWRIIKVPGGLRVGDIIAKTQVVYSDDWDNLKLNERE